MTGQVATHWRRFGDGPERAIAIHCTLGHAGSWRGVGQALADRLNLHAYDLPSHGKSGDFDVTGDLHEACTAPGRAALAAPAHAIGHSFGATVALRLAVERPQAVRSLTLIEPVFFAAAGEHDPDALVAYHQRAAGYANALAAEDWLLAAKLFNASWGDGTPWDDIPEGARRYMTERMWFIPYQSPAIFDDNAGILNPGRLESTDIPCLMLKGSRSPAIISAVHAGLAARLPNARVVTLNGVGHMGPTTHPQRVAAEIRRHLEMA